MIVMASSLLAQEVLVDPPTPVVDAPAPVVDAPAPAVDAPPVNKMSAMADKLTPGQKDSLKAAMDVVQKSPELEKLHEEWQMAVSPEKKEQKAAEARQLLKKLLIQQDPSLEPLVSKFPN
jgi:hypothetical protein